MNENVQDISMEIEVDDYIVYRDPGKRGNRRNN